MHSGRTVEFLPYSDADASAVSIDCVLDVSGLGDVVGIEILGLASRTSDRIMDGVTEARDETGRIARVNYDASSDALYAKVPGDRPLDQIDARAVLRRNADGRITMLVIDPEN